jgi:hypothetical protein
MEKPIIENVDAEFTTSNAGLSEGKKYYAIIVGSSLNDMARGDDKMNLRLATVPVGTDLSTVKQDDWVPRIASSRALADSGILTKEQKKQAMQQGTLFEVKWTAGEQRTSDDGRTYTQKIWSSKRVEEEAD